MRYEIPRVITRRSALKSAVVAAQVVIAAHAPILANRLQAPSRGLWDALGWDDPVALDWGDEVVALAQEEGETQNAAPLGECDGEVCADGLATSGKCRNKGDCGGRCCLKCKLLVCSPTSNILDPESRHNIFVYRNDGPTRGSCNGGGVGRHWSFIRKKDQQTDDWQSVCDLRDTALPPSTCCCTHVC